MTERAELHSTSERPRAERLIVVGMVLLVELGVLAYAIPMSFLLTVLFATDTFAFQATELDWWIAGGKKFAAICIAAAILVSCMLIVNRPLFRWIGLRNPRLALYLSAAAGIAMLGAGMIGTIMFILSKPFI